MALFITHCAICGGKITEDTPALSTSGVAFEPPHPLYRFCDTGLHQQCLVGWPHRREFSFGYVMGSGHVLRSDNEWNLICGPLGYGPCGKPGWPYYAEIRLHEWPVRLYADFERWGAYVANREWEPNFIPEVNEAVRKVLHEFPQTDEELREYLWRPLIATIQTAPEHRSRYVATVSLNLYDDEKFVAKRPCWSRH
ncbi:MAG TPA: hypothetical protein VGE39_08535 [Prosthecobacter sp.]